MGFNKNAVKYVVNEEARTVVCYIEGTKNDFINYISKSRFPALYVASGGHVMNIPNRFVGIAKCGPEDNWDPKLGKLIAYNRMRHNYNRAMDKAMSRSLNALVNNVADFVDEYGRYQIKVDKTEFYRNKIIDENLDNF